MSTRRRLSESISEGDGISLLVHVATAAEIAAAETLGAEGLATGGGVERTIAAASPLPVLAGGDAPTTAEGVAAWRLVAELHADELEERYAAAQELGLECVVDVQDDEELELVLQRIAPEIVLLSPRGADEDEEPIDHVLELLPDVPAGMLVIAELRSPALGDVQALERAGVDAVLVDAANLDAMRPAG